MSTSKDKHEKEHLDRKQLAKIKIIAPNVPNIRDQSGTNSRRRIEKGICTLEQVLQLAEDGKLGVKNGACFNSQEYEAPSNKELVKIQIEIRRTIPRDRISTSPVRRSLRDPATVVFSRRPDEGTKAIFDRDEIKHWIPDVPEQRVIAMIEDKPVQRNLMGPSPLRRRVEHAGSYDRSGRCRSRSRSPRNHTGGKMRDKLVPLSSIHQSAMHSKVERKADWLKIEEERHHRRDNRDSEGKYSSISRAFMDNTTAHSEKSDVHSRLGRRELSNAKGYGDKSTTKKDDSALYDEDKVLDRDELERLRLANANSVKPWEVNPEFVPRGTYFEHDNRETDLNSGTYRGRGRGGREYDRGRGTPGQWYQRGSRTAYRGNFRRTEESKKWGDSDNRGYSNRRSYHENRDDKFDSGANSGYYKRK